MASSHRRPVPDPSDDRLFEWIAGDLALDFANTVSWDGDILRGDLLGSYRDLVRWGREAGVLGADRSAPLLAAAERHPEMAREAWRVARETRSLIHEIFSALAQGQPVPEARLQDLSRAAASAYAAARLVPAGSSGGFTRDWAAAPDDFGQVLRPVIAAAAALLLSKRRSIVRACANEHCGWLFLDTSRNHMRRWCDMRVCGSRAKARRHYARSRGREQDR
jgi:predicted RNA-binding Zn ribbon-like protein